MRRAALLLIVVATFGGCSSSGLSTMYPDAVQSGSAVKNDTAIVLVANDGSEAINYLQFVHSSLPAINARGINLAPGGIVAIPVPVGTNQLYLSNYTTAARPGGYFTNGSSYGYIRVDTPPFDVRSPGLYYVATIFPGQGRKFEVKPTAQQLAKLKKERPELAGLNPVNFSWPN